MGWLQSLSYLHSWQNLNIAGRHIFHCELCRDLRDFGIVILFEVIKASKGSILWLSKFEGENSFSMPSSPQFYLGLNSQHMKWREWNREWNHVFLKLFTPVQCKQKLPSHKLKYSIPGAIRVFQSNTYRFHHRISININGCCAANSPRV